LTREFRAQLENQTHREENKVLKSDNGGEYTSDDFKGFLKGGKDQERFDSPIQPLAK